MHEIVSTVRRREDTIGTCAHEPPHLDFNPPVCVCMAGLDLALVELLPGDKLALPSVTRDALIWVRNAGSGLFLDAARAAVNMLALIGAISFGTKSVNIILL